MHCWPLHWLEAATKAGFATYKGDGRYEFESDKMRNMLEVFASAILDAEQEENNECSNAWRLSRNAQGEPA